MGSRVNSDPIWKSATVQDTSTAAESDEYAEALYDKYEGASYLKFINTGLIDRYSSLWGVLNLTHKGRKFYSYKSSTLEAGEYLFAIRTIDVAGIENDTLARLKIQVKPTTIDAINILRVEAVWFSLSGEFKIKEVQENV